MDSPVRSLLVKKLINLGATVHHLLIPERMTTLADDLGRPDEADEWGARTERIAEELDYQSKAERVAQFRESIQTDP